MTEIYLKRRLSDIFVLDRGVVGEYKWVVTTCGTHPCAYVSLPKDHKHNYKSYDIFTNVPCHGGFTFGERLEVTPFNDKNEFFYGWDYAHCMDCYDDTTFGFTDDFDRKKWTLEEIKEEVFAVINYFKKIEEIEVRRSCI